jgi:hypothetical protein
MCALMNAVLTSGFLKSLLGWIVVWHALSKQRLVSALNIVTIRRIGIPSLF